MTATASWLPATTDEDRKHFEWLLYLRCEHAWFERGVTAAVRDDQGDAKLEAWLLPEMLDALHKQAGCDCSLI